MAQTIQIRRGTGSAVPSSLADGELAINLDSGRLYYGSGSAVLNNFRLEQKGDLTEPEGYGNLKIEEVRDAEFFFS